jgi:hypothetical protein
MPQPATACRHPAWQFGFAATKPPERNVQAESKQTGITPPDFASTAERGLHRFLASALKERYNCHWYFFAECFMPSL